MTTAMTLFILFSIAMIALTIYEWRSDPESHDLQMRPRCLRCDGMRDTYHRCPDARDAVVTGDVDSRSTPV